MNLPVKDMAGKPVGEIEVSDAIFGAPVNTALMHQALMRQLSNARLGTHNTKKRGEVAGGGRKPWRQKGTSRARHGSTRSPIWVGGGIIFGPHPRSYVKAMPKKMHRAALRSALSAKAGAGQVVVLDQLSMNEPKTKQAVAMLKALELDGQSVLLVMGEPQENVARSVANLPKVKLLSASFLNVRDLLGYDMVLMARDAVEHVETWLGTATAQGRELVAAEMEK